MVRTAGGRSGRAGTFGVSIFRGRSIEGTPRDRGIAETSTEANAIRGVVFRGYKDNQVTSHIFAAFSCSSAKHSASLLISSAYSAPCAWETVAASRK